MAQQREKWRVQSWEQIDLPAKVETMRRKTRPWKSIFALLFAIAAAVFAYQAREQKGFFKGTTPSITTHLIWIGLGVA